MDRPSQKPSRQSQHNWLPTQHCATRRLWTAPPTILPFAFNASRARLAILNVSVSGDAARDFSVTAVNDSVFDVCSSGSSDIPSGTHQFLLAIVYSPTTTLCLST
ncbi:uncharacterized protein LOC112566635 [Pomacea canaliculata]|uniref:uncharacterized protein LOC112566635 n=1 Tax=Pomacea canaliculata TaxID=400727 RepID=UPI000D72AE2E|nr:uncharacterized protein LOC112566635 [Pomacea canaliculata]